MKHMCPRIKNSKFYSDYNKGLFIGVAVIVLP